ncbi:acyltransferase family protein [Thermomonas sp.]|jgi:surface polysaccharide O-acyltransferase-like enzyme|uniref:acyltransferase family protein n=1 Tax=Thermomonas sp. TaxID=1971895 RepID=UPI00257C128A|nr:acyltransferase family protein [Thermomonas sp.]
MQRRLDIDRVRVLAFGLLVLYHVGMYYVSWDWHVKSPHASATLEPLMLLTSPWRMSLLFVVSGVATAFLLGKASRGDGRFLGPRSWRLLLPLVFGMYVVVPPQVYYELVEKVPGGFHAGYAAFMGTYLRGGDFYCAAPGDCVDAPTWNHLWFLAYLWAYTVVLWLLLKLAPAAMQSVGGWLGRRLSGPGALLWPMAWLALARLALAGRFESTHDLVDDWYNHAQYLPMFLLGYLLAFSPGFWEALQRHRKVALGIALAGYAVITGVWYFSGYSDEVPPPDAVRVLVRLVWGINQWCAIAALFGYAYRLRDVDSPALRYLTPAVFPIYILHQTVIVALAHGAKPLALPPLLEGPLLVVLTFAACFGGYELIRRIPVLRPLFGLRREPTRLPLPDAPPRAG